MIKLAWRNIWRNKRRTLITSASIFFAVLLAILMRGFHLGAWDSMIDNVLHSYVGYVQVHKSGYWNDKSLDYCFRPDESLQSIFHTSKDIKGLVPRFESFALASAGTKTKGVMVAGIDPNLENAFSNLSGKIVAGKYLNHNTKGVIVAERLSKALGVHVSDTLVLLSQGYQGASANGLFVVQGIVRLPAPEFDNIALFMPLELAQAFYSAPNMLTSVVVDVANPSKTDKVAAHIKAALNADLYETMTWKDMLKELYQMYLTDNAGGFIMLSILYLIVGFGVFGTVLMMIAERKREFGIMIAVGMHRTSIVKMVAAELFFIGFIGLLAGLLASFPILLYFHYYPIRFSGTYAKAMEVYGMEPTLPIAWRIDYILNQALVVTFLVVAAICYPVLALQKLNLIKALRRQ